MSFFDINTIAFTILGYGVSYIELIATVSGMLCVYLATQANILTWPTGIVNEFFLFILFYQVHLYADMALQLYFFIVTLYGWYYWKYHRVEKSITTLPWIQKLQMATVILAGTLLAGYLFSNIHIHIPQYFAQPAAYPYTDSFIMTGSIVASVLLAKKILDTWYIWILVDVVCTLLYWKKQIVFLSLEYLLFTGLALYGLLHWQKIRRYG